MRQARARFRKTRLAPLASLAFVPSDDRWPREIVMKTRAHARGAALTSLVLIVSSAGFAKDKDSRADAATIKARQHFFGPENVDPLSAAVRKDRVIFSWFSNTSFAVAA